MIWRWSLRALAIRICCTDLKFKWNIETLTINKNKTLGYLEHSLVSCFNTKAAFVWWPSSIRLSSATSSLVKLFKCLSFKHLWTPCIWPLFRSCISRLFSLRRFSSWLTTSMPCFNCAYKQMNTFKNMKTEMANTYVYMTPDSSII